MSGLGPPLFKYLTSNDLGLRGHQAGPVIPRKLIWFFPELDVTSISSADPTVEALIRVATFRNGNFVGIGARRFHCQTWGATRKPEYRITGEFGPLFDGCKPSDLLLIAASKDDYFSYRMDVLTQNTPNWTEFDKTIRNADRKGILPKYRTKKPSGYFGDIGKTIRGFVDEFRSDGETDLFDDDDNQIVSHSTRRSRSQRFRTEVLSAYAGKCAITGDRLRTPDAKILEVEAAHIIPREARGSNSIRNGICLNRRLHWAFDNGLWSVNQEFRVVVANSIRTIEENRYIAELEGTKITLPMNSNQRPSAEALDWHRKNILLT